MSKPRGRPAYVPPEGSRKTVESMAACGIREDDIARVVQIAPKTLRKHFREELDTGKIKAVAQVATSLVRRAMGTGPHANTAAIFYLKTQGGWRETPTAVDLHGTVKHGIDADGAFRELVALLDGVARVAAGGAGPTIAIDHDQA